MTLSQNIHDITNPRNGECGLALLYLSFLLYLKFLAIVVASAMFVTQVTVLEDESAYTMGGCAGSQAYGVDVLHEVL